MTTYDPFVVPDYEHYTGEDKSQELVTSISGSTEVVPSLEREVGQMAGERHLIQTADREIRANIAANKAPAQRVVTATGEIVFKQVFCQPNVPAQLVAYNYNRSRLIISGGTGANVAISESTPTPPLVIANPPMNSIVIGYAAQVFFSRELYTQRDVWALSDLGIWLSVQEEFYVS